MKTWNLDTPWFSIEDLKKGLASRKPLKLEGNDLERVRASADFLATKIRGGAPPVYGVNTGFGSLCDILIPEDKIDTLQKNLLRSHACGTGDKVPPEIVRIILLLKVLSLRQGYSGVRVETLSALIHLYNEDKLPVIYELGSLGASGDLAPLAHLSLPLIGEGEVCWKEKRVAAKEAGLTPLHLGPKEGLALINGTQFSTGYALWAIMRSRELLDWAIKITALSMDVFGCRKTPLDPKIHQIRRQQGQISVAQKILHYLEGTGLSSISGKNVQDPYSFRCAPQVLGATLDTMDYVAAIIEREANAVTDNPNIFCEEGEVLEGGNFHAQPIALVCDQLAIALSEVASIAERRIFLLVSGLRDLPVYLTHQPGLESGMMIVQYTAASIVSQNKQWCTPASVDSIVSSKGQEDHVSMAANAATKLRKVILNVERVLAMELLVSAQALDFRRPLKTSPPLEKLHSAYRAYVSHAGEDRPFFLDIQKSIAFLTAFSEDQIL